MCSSGRGGKEGAVEKCTPCRGTGMIVRIAQLAPGMVQQMQSVCHECQGQGERINPKHRCKTCVGKKVNRERKILEVHVDKGKLDTKIPTLLLNPFIQRGQILTILASSHLRVLLLLLGLKKCYQLVGKQCFI